MLCKTVIKLFIILVVSNSVAKTDEYLKEFFKGCATTKRPYFCVTYRLLQYFHDFDYEGPLLKNSGFKIVKIEPKNDEDDITIPRYYNEDSAWEKLLKFFKRKLFSFINSHGIAIELPDGVNVVQGRSIGDDDNGISKKSAGNLTQVYGEARGHKLKVKKIFIMSIIIMAKLLKIKILLATVFFVLLFIKKIILLTAIAFPSVLTHIKTACQKHHQAATIVDEPPHSTSSWFGSRQGSDDRIIGYDHQPYYSNHYSYNAPYSYYY